MLERVKIRTNKDDVFELTSQVQEIVRKSGVKSGICIVSVPHTTAGLTITSFWDTAGFEDIQDEIKRLIPTRIDFKHQYDTPQDAAGHVKSVLIGTNMSLIIEDSKLLLGSSQGIYFLEFDGPRDRECFVKVYSD